MRKRRHTVSLVVGAVILALVSIGGYVIFNKFRPLSKQTPTPSQHNDTARSYHTYRLNILGDMVYNATSSNRLTFDVRSQNNATVKKFDSVNQPPLHLIAIRKDRTNFQLLTPHYDKSTGLFTIPNIIFPTDGEYRLFASFTPSDAQTDDMGVKRASAPYQDIQVGNGQYTAQPSEGNMVTSTVNGLETQLSLLGGDNPGQPIAYAGSPLPLAVTLRQNNAPYISLQPSEGLLGCMIAISPDLQLILATGQPDATTLQTGLLIFNISFPTAGLYKIYVQVKSDNKLQLLNYNYSVVSLPASQSNNAPMQSKGNQPQ